MKKGDKVIAISDSPDLKIRKGREYEVADISSHGPCCVYIKATTGRRYRYAYSISRFKLMEEKKMNTVKYFRTKKKLPELNKGAILISGYGYEGFKALSGFNKKMIAGSGCVYSSAIVVEQPEWFEEVFLLSPRYATADESKKLGLKKSG